MPPLCSVSNQSAPSQLSVSALCLYQCCRSALYLISFTLSQQSVSLSHFALVFSNLCKHSVSELRLRALFQSIYLALRLSAYYQGSISAFYVSALLLLYFNFILHISTDKRSDVWSRPSCIYTQIFFSLFRDQNKI